MKKEKMKNIIKGFESEHELLMFAYDDLEEKYHELLHKVFAFRMAITWIDDDTRRHRRMMAKLRREWPELWRAIDELMSTLDKQHWGEDGTN